ncbi:hypothetical protein [Streptomyces sp. NPDC051098]|uniref:hypothetical protein n=1 Tax=Streptomyces sp. NPDC051098 TaxID=3155411 RepID=UPI003416A540
MSGQEPWTIERICDALGHPTLSQRFIAEINKAPAHELLTVFATWQQRAIDLRDAAERGHTLAAADAAGEEAPGTWIDITDQVQTAAARARGAA